MHFDLIFFCQSNFYQEVRDDLPLVSLQLQYLPILWMIHYSTITGKLLQVVNIISYKLGCALAQYDQRAKCT